MSGRNDRPRLDLGGSCLRDDLRGAHPWLPATCRPRRISPAAGRRIGSCADRLEPRLSNLCAGLDARRGPNRGAGPSTPGRRIGVTQLYFLWLIAGLHTVDPLLAAFVSGESRWALVAGGTLPVWSTDLLHDAGNPWTLWLDASRPAQRFNPLDAVCGVLPCGLRTEGRPTGRPEIAGHQRRDRRSWQRPSGNTVTREHFPCWTRPSRFATWGYMSP